MILFIELWPEFSQNFMSDSMNRLKNDWIQFSLLLLPMDIISKIEKIIIITPEKKFHPYDKVSLHSKQKRSPKTGLINRLLYHSEVINARNFHASNLLQEYNANTCLFISLHIHKNLLSLLHSINKPLLALSYRGILHETFIIEDKKVILTFLNEVSSVNEAIKDQVEDKALQKAISEGLIPPLDTKFLKNGKYQIEYLEGEAEIEEYDGKKWKTNSIPGSKKTKFRDSEYFGETILDIKGEKLGKKCLKSIFPESFDKIIKNEIKTAQEVMNKKAGIVVVKYTDSLLLSRFIQKIKSSKELIWAEYDVSVTSSIIAPEFDGLIFYSMDELSIQFQEFIRNSVQRFYKNDALVIYCYKQDSFISEMILKDAVLIRIPDFYQTGFSKSSVFFYILFGFKLPFLDWSFIYTEYFHEKLRFVQDFYPVYKIVKNKLIEPDHIDFLDPAFWKSMELLYCSLVPVKKETDNYIIYRGDFWEVKFKKQPPLLIAERLGMHYIAYMMNNEGKLFDADVLRKSITGELSKKSQQNSVPAIRKNIGETIKHIENLEKKLKYEPEFSTYLRKAFLPKSIELHNGKLYSSEDYFMDKLNQCMCKLPSDDNVYWYFISSPAYFSAGRKYRKPKH